MEEFKSIITDLTTNDWNKRLRSIDIILTFIKNHEITINGAQSTKFVALIDTFSKLLQDNNIKV